MHLHYRFVTEYKDKKNGGRFRRNFRSCTTKMTLFEEEIMTVPLTHEALGQPSQSPQKKDVHQGALKFPGS